MADYSHLLRRKIKDDLIEYASRVPNSASTKQIRYLTRLLCAIVPIPPSIDQANSSALSVTDHIFEVPTPRRNLTKKRASELICQLQQPIV